ncbi:non-hydrolyzing UDP-N-acetylglucosamine 2-epimerase [Methanobacterium petrolearium]|uniref:non-hydrolyzing UDP-N-acetylglucosamine 2-epimerase n=1 Tax=Methanobacterium petrolearium TaxID=710190 RepID=UPI001AE7F532|nr:UDP-N-acetylglucosamine 2-epimerase (non-hydrolyzing) [Methanobacterium petrolearium]MBP1945128.1 UDP-N-acetylglucosamine 2-epimerase (non-hydrolyzing) [Methanobacterium petrolearium]BDZ71053.1 UDP-N-acetylglucosamine 2-epimerase (non-hydrolyzing) [Methanobacterium petrolearium]
MKIAFIIGTRPEIIKMSPLIDEVDKRGINYILVHTGQHYDHEMSQQFFLDLELKEPDYNIGVGSDSHGKQTATMLKGIEDVLTSEKPDIVLVQGDTNAVLAGALAAAKLHIAVGHVEAGLRSYDKTMPEEINRMVADVCTNLFFVPTEETAINLLFEGISPKDIFITGNTVVDACYRNLKIARKNSSIMSKLGLEGDILSLTLHRAENVDDKERLENIIEALLNIENLTIVFPVHPRTVKTLKEFGMYSKLKKAPHIKMIKPVGYLDFLILQSHSKMMITDSGGIQEEAITLNVPCLTLRYNTERPETVQAGGNILVGSDTKKITNNVSQILNDHEMYRRMREAPNPYGDGKTSEKILDAILDSYNQGKLEIKPPEEIATDHSKKLLRVDADITVAEFENKNPKFMINLVFDDDTPTYPHPNISLKGKTIIVSY